MICNRCKCSWFSQSAFAWCASFKLYICIVKCFLRLMHLTSTHVITRYIICVALDCFVNSWPLFVRTITFDWLLWQTWKSTKSWFSVKNICQQRTYHDLGMYPLPVIQCQYNMIRPVIGSWWGMASIMVQQCLLHVNNGHGDWMPLREWLFVDVCILILLWRQGGYWPALWPSGL